MAIELKFEQLLQIIYTLEHEQLMQVQNAVKNRVNDLAAVKRYSLKQGDAVQFVRADGFTVIGRVKSIGPKNVRVLASDGVTWVVHPNLLSLTR